jgi:hypothetical protein
LILALKDSAEASIEGSIDFLINGMSLIEKNEFGLDPRSFVEENFPKAAPIQLKRIRVKICHLKTLLYNENT